MSLPSGGRGGALRAAAHCAGPVPRPLPGPAGPRSRIPAHGCLAPSPAAPVPAVPAPGWLHSVPEGCAARAVGTEHASPSGTALRPAPLHPSRGAALRREGGQHPSRWKWAASRSSAGSAPRPAPLPVPSVRRPGAAAPCLRRCPAPGSRLVLWSWRGRTNPKPVKIQILTENGVSGCSHASEDGVCPGGAE
ncbi:ras-related protein Rab-30 isoform X2 [Passer montanus]|uniref:ras-related protein Rab-30 isoform X2 n=1 Tax=Passer montanus TaxID=9160 RepID=UPI0019600376|nr:ras-related protein Rab-30 isoform X2 [Passer montanus]